MIKFMKKVLIIVIMYLILLILDVGIYLTLHQSFRALRKESNKYIKCYWIGKDKWSLNT